MTSLDAIAKPAVIPDVEAGTAAVRLEGVWYRYAQHPPEAWAVRDVSFEVPAGSAVLISGPSGGGKTTLLRCLNGLIPHFFAGEIRGRVELFGEDTRQLTLAQIACRVGTVFQNPDAHLLTTTVEAEVAFGVENLGIEAREGRCRCEWAMALTGADRLRGRLVGSLSGGEKQRVAIASVLAMRPRILLLDEPLSNLDPHGVQEFLDELPTLQAAGLTIVIVEQRIRQLADIVDRLIWLEDHRLQWEGPMNAEPALEKCRPFYRERRRSAQAARSKNGSGLAATAAPARVEFDRVSYRYPHGARVLEDVSLVLEGGEWVCIAGKNGAGKTTLAKLMNRLLVPSGGRVVICGMETGSHRMRELSRMVGYVFQNPLHSLCSATIGEELSLYPRNQGHPGDEVRRRVGEVLALFGLDGRGNDSPFVLSGGEQQRVAIAGIVTGLPPIIVFDEPTLGMTSDDIERLVTLIGELKRAGHLVVMITHDLDLVRRADRVVVLADGGIHADGPPEVVITEGFVDAVFAP